ncbi:MAG: N-acetyltransferase, partial [Candidatus Binatia bacterium]
EHIGPVVASSEDAAKNLLVAALEAAGGKPVYVDPFLHASGWIEFLASMGFRKERDLIRMYRGPNRFPGQPHQQWAAAGPELG